MVQGVPRGPHHVTVVQELPVGLYWTVRVRRDQRPVADRELAVPLTTQTSTPINPCPRLGRSTSPRRSTRSRRTPTCGPRPVFIVAWDEHGGMFDHVPPPTPPGGHPRGVRDPDLPGWRQRRRASPRRRVPRSLHHPFTVDGRRMGVQSTFRSHLQPAVPGEGDRGRGLEHQCLAEEDLRRPHLRPPPSASGTGQPTRPPCPARAGPWRWPNTRWRTYPHPPSPKITRLPQSKRRAATHHPASRQKLTLSSGRRAQSLVRASGQERWLARSVVSGVCCGHDVDVVSRGWLVVGVACGRPGPGRLGFGAPAGQPTVVRRCRNPRRTRAGVSRPGRAVLSHGRRISTARARA